MTNGSYGPHGARLTHRYPEARTAAPRLPNGVPEVDAHLRATTIRDLDHSKTAFTFAVMKPFFGKSFHVYITASKPRGVLYVGMSSDLIKRATEHRDHSIDGFTKRYWVDRLVYFEAHDSAGSAQRREYLMKRWRRDWKIELIETANPTWADLYADLLRLHDLES